MKSLTIGIREAKAQLSRLVSEAERGTDSARELVRVGSWRRLALQPDWARIDELATQWPVPGAHLWHFAVASTLRRELPELRMITFDSRLAAATASMGFAFPS
jgi:hypothetical protein